VPWPLVKLIPRKTHFGFVRFAFFASFASIVLVLASFGSMISAGYRESPVSLYEHATGSPMDRLSAILSRGFNLGIDFTGGTLLEIHAEADRYFATARRTRRAQYR
jgi:preprotein translocase subunit SecF